MTRLRRTFAVLALSVIALGVAAQPAGAVTVTQANTYISVKQQSGTVGPVVLDVRNASEYAGEHIPGSLHIPYGDLAERLDELPRDRTIATICRGGKRSGLAASILQRAGFEVTHVGRGVGVWRDGGHPVESGAEAATSAP